MDEFPSSLQSYEKKASINLKTDLLEQLKF